MRSGARNITGQLLLWVLCLVPAWAQGVPGLSNVSSDEISPQKLWAVVIGVSEYQYLPKKAWLSSCHKDAEAIADFLQSPRGGNLPPEHLKLLVNGQATARKIRIALDFVITESKPGDVIYIFYAGHGKVRLYGGGEAAYLMAHDSEPEFLNATAIPMDEIRRYVDVHLQRASQVILITDACHAGAIMTSSLEVAPETRSISEYLQFIGERTGALNIMACRRDEVAYEDSRLGGHGVLTYAILKALNGDGRSDADGTVRLQDLLEYIAFKVPRLTNQQQHPRFSSNYRDEFPVSDLSKSGPNLSLPDSPGDRLQSNSDSVFSSARRGVTLKVVGAERMAELYLVREGHQLTVGRALSPMNTLVTENVTPGQYELVQLSQGGQEKRWTLDLDRKSGTFDVRTGEFR